MCKLAINHTFEPAHNLNHEKLEQQSKLYT